MKLIKQVIKQKFFSDLKKLIDEKRFFHSIILTCEDEQYLKEFATGLALALNCRDLCLNCEQCAKILNNSHPDVLAYPKEKNFVVADSEDITDQMIKKPIVSDKKVFIISNFEKATIQAQNKLLKTLEEPTGNTFFIICALSTEQILSTIKSRSITYELPPFSEQEMRAYLQSEVGEFDEEILKNNRLYPGLIHTLAYDTSFEKDLGLVRTIVLKMKSSKDVLKFAKDFGNKENFERRLRLLQNAMENMLLAKESLGKSDFNEVIEEYSVSALIEIIKKINLTKKQYDANVNPVILSDCLLLNILEVKFLCK